VRNGLRADSGLSLNSLAAGGASRACGVESPSFSLTVPLACPSRGTVAEREATPAATLGRAGMPVTSTGASDSGDGILQAVRRSGSSAQRHGTWRQLTGVTAYPDRPNPTVRSPFGLGDFGRLSGNGSILTAAVGAKDRGGCWAAGAGPSTFSRSTVPGCVIASLDGMPGDEYARRSSPPAPISRSVLGPSWLPCVAVCNVVAGILMTWPRVIRQVLPAVKVRVQTRQISVARFMPRSSTDFGVGPRLAAR